MFTFELPSRKVAVARKVEKYSIAVCTTSAFVGGGTNRSFIFNKAAVTALDIKAKSEEPGKEQPQPTLAFAFGTGETKQVFVVNTSGQENPSSLRYSVTSNKVSDRPVFDYVMSAFKLDESVEHEFALVDTGENVGGKIVYELVLLTDEQKATAKDVSKNAISNTEELFDTTASTEEFSLGNATSPIENNEAVSGAAYGAPFVADTTNDAADMEAMEDPFNVPTATAEQAFGDADASDAPDVTDEEFFL